MLVEITLSFLILAIVYALDELFLIDQAGSNKRLIIYKGSWKTHFKINPLKGIIFGIWAHSILIGIAGYFAFSVVEDLIYQIIKKRKGTDFNWSEYVETWKGVPKYYIWHSIIVILLIAIYLVVGI